MLDTRSSPETLACAICGNRRDNHIHVAREMMLGLREEFRYLECGNCRTGVGNREALGRLRSRKMEPGGLAGPAPDWTTCGNDGNSARSDSAGCPRA
jgi:hypothetical protein